MEHARFREAEDNEAPLRALVLGAPPALRSLWALWASSAAPRVAATFAEDDTAAAAHGVCAHWSGEPFHVAIVVQAALGPDGAPLVPLSATMRACLLLDERAHAAARAGGSANYLVALVPRTEAELAAVVARLREARPHAAALGAFATRYALPLRPFIVLQDAVDGFSDTQIARQLRVTPSTVASHWTAIFARTGLRSQRAVFSALLREMAESDALRAAGSR